MRIKPFTIDHLHHYFAAEGILTVQACPMGGTMPPKVVGGRGYGVHYVSWACKVRVANISQPSKDTPSFAHPPPPPILAITPAIQLQSNVELGAFMEQLVTSVAAFLG
ncbi:hypothetical protein GH714_033151 [Hevea brasiliensis]|uniref:Uncharacterized protein n=1 Tax=Hevea brasiliensis TaxID=3981 RepID=A0A6A6N901_HEVBR|nr:hypothetical protein GH714_033151 [Hevea brasiliensis]